MNIEHHPQTPRRESIRAGALAQLKRIDDPHIRDIGERWDAIHPEDVELYERYTGLQNRFDARAEAPLNEAFYAEVDELLSAFYERQQATSLLSPNDPTANLIGFLGTKIGGLSGQCQLERRRQQKRPRMAI